MRHSDLIQQIRVKKSFLCIGLDLDIDRLPSPFKKNIDSLFSFSKDIIDATSAYSIAYKPNLAFFEAYGAKGWGVLEQIMDYINSTYPELFTIADAKRGDIGTSSERYAKAFFEVLNFDAVTLSPYMGRDSISPFLAYKNKHVILLGLTSNLGAQDFQLLGEGKNTWFAQVIQNSQTWSNSDRIWYVVGATKAEYLKLVRSLVPNTFLLVPGIGAQGGNLSEVVRFGLNEQCGLLVNSSRGIIYKSNGSDFARAAEVQSHKLQSEMEVYLKDIRDFL
ncbi:MAG: orotidine-5'-phosphate decarboxylase [Flavobacteriaceae bacterium]|nr:orotidine-5'-phosphate decarboxylase [Flavobacteriaceae bacterium]